jgi:TonB family protein
MNTQDGVHASPMATAGSFACALIRRAAHRAPPDLAERLEEEWLADLATRRGPLARALFALGCRWAARSIALEFGVPARVAAVRLASATAAGPALVAERPSAPRASPRLVFMLAIAGVHVLLVYALAAGLPREFPIPTLPPSLRPFFIERHPVPPAVPGIQVAPLTVPPLVVPVPLVHVDDPRDAPAIVATTATQAIEPAGGSAMPVRRIVGGPGAGFPDAEVFYPENMRRLGREGAATVRVCVDAAGRLTQAPQIGASSGNALFDDSALRLARAGSGHYRATLEDGRPVDSCYPFRVRFRMQ